ncbi:ABC transporter permease [Enterobacteriaceae endosymbiont of Neohaemonia nigricornis]|uniref:ABC transporter permease n=1 Tax=Enterobacteriaceae endosymbiont of Neohaemonia nigricornis TaxID=2675792 RepID=UPI001449CEC2|nr:ABC transporter permease [Enterobacteriaceae endosymbiont of Neohaemonia nigricornis]QJC30437.1 ABC transporter permease [Enterobacteriaceae endosymbiont of Neohaemonia nigricornis]
MLNVNLIALKTIWIKEINRFRRIWIQTLIPPIMTITLYFIIFGNLMGSHIEKLNGFSYIQFIIPGLIMMSMINNSYSNVASSFFSAKFQHNIEELLIAPVSTHIIILGYIGGGIFRSLIIGTILLLISTLFISFKIYSWFFLIIISLLTSILFSLSGLLNAIFAKDFDDINFIPTFILTPLTYLGGVFYSTSILPIFWQKLSNFNPIFYIVSGFRYSFLGIHNISVWNTIFLIIMFIFIIYIYCWNIIQKRQKLKI